MAPHSVALVAVASYLMKGGSGSSFTVEVSGKRTQKYSVHISGTTYESKSFDERLTCAAKVYTSGSKITVDKHDHSRGGIKTNLHEEYYINGNVIENGAISGSNRSERNGSFKGELEFAKGKVSVYSSPAGRTFTASFK